MTKSATAVIPVEPLCALILVVKSVKSFGVAKVDDTVIGLAAPVAVGAPCKVNTVKPVPKLLNVALLVAVAFTPVVPAAALTAAAVA